MSREKRLAVVLSVGLGILLLGCTVASQVIYLHLLPQVQVVEGSWEDTGFVLPAEAVYPSAQGDCVYYIEEKPGRVGTKYVVKEVLVTVEENCDVAENMEQNGKEQASVDKKNEGKEGTEQASANGTKVIVRGIYNPDWVYAANASAPLSDGVEVKIVP